jgi:peptide/nickel transport system substrate-binding protein
MSKHHAGNLLDMSRRQVMRMLATGGLMAATASGGLLSPGWALAAGATPRKGGRLKIATPSSSDADTLDPAKCALSTDYVRVNLFYNGLTKLDSSLTPQGVLAEEIDTQDAISWIIKLRKNVRFHDGQLLMPADVVYSLLRHKDAAVGSKVKVVADQLASVTASGPNQVTIKLVNANADLPTILADAHFLVIKGGTRNFSTAVGTGAFKCKEFKPGVRTVAVRNGEYWKSALPYLDEVELFGIPDEAARVNALLSGEVHWISNVSPPSVLRVKSTPGYSVLENKSGGYTDLIIRQDILPGSSVDFTLGMKYLMNREQMRSVVAHGFADLGNDQPIPPSNRFYFADLPQRPYDPDKARFHLKKAGVLGSTIPIVCSDAADNSVDMVLLMQQSAHNIGLTLDVRRVPSDGYWSNYWMKSPVGFGNVNPRPTAGMIFTQFFKSDSAWNESAWKNEQFDQLLLAARAEPNIGKSKKMYADMQVLVNQKCGIGIPLFFYNLEGVNARIHGIESIPLGAFMGYTAAEYVWLDI